MPLLFLSSPQSVHIIGLRILSPGFFPSNETQNFQPKRTQMKRFEKTFFPFLTLKFGGGVQTTSSSPSTPSFFPFSAPTSCTCFNGLSRPLIPVAPFPAVLFSRPIDSLPLATGATMAVGGEGDFLSMVMGCIPPLRSAAVGAIVAVIEFRSPFLSTRLVFELEFETAARPFWGSNETPSINALSSIDTALGAAGAGDLTSSLSMGICGYEGEHLILVSEGRILEMSLDVGGCSAFGDGGGGDGFFGD